MRPLTLAERGVSDVAVSLRALLSGRRDPVSGRTEVSLEGYAEEIVASGFPGLRHPSGRPLRAQLDGYLRRIVDHDFIEMGRQPYRDILERLWIIEPLAGWLPTRSPISRLSAPPKHHLVDPALAARLLGAGVDALLEGRSLGPPIRRDGTLLGHLFESLVTLCVRVYAQAAEAEVKHLRTMAGEREVDLIVERDDHRVVAIETKLARAVGDGDVRHLLWLRAQMGDDLLDEIVLTTGTEAYRRRDGIAVVPVALLGP